MPRRSLVLCGLALVACSSSHLERARSHQLQALDADARGDEPRWRGELEAAVAEAQQSIADEEEGEAAPQAWLLVASARMDLEQVVEAEAALREVRRTGTRPWRDWQRRVLVAAHCRLAVARGWDYWAALCFDHLAEASKGADPAMRDFAAIGLANAHARTSPGYLDLVAYDAPLFRRLFGLARAHPLDADLLSVFAKRLAFNCTDDDFLREIEGWRALQTDVLEAAKHLATHSSARRMQSTCAALKRATRGRLCARQTSGASFLRTIASAPRRSPMHQRASRAQ